MGFGGGMSEKLNLGSIIYYSSTPIALMIKPKYSEGLWKIGLLINYKSRDWCTIINENGEYEKCKSSMIMPYTANI